MGLTATVAIFCLVTTVYGHHTSTNTSNGRHTGTVVTNRPQSPTTNQLIRNLDKKLTFFAAKLDFKLSALLDRKVYRDCSELIENGERRSGVYKIKPVTTRIPFHVYCDMETDGGGWTVFQRRMDGSENFFRGWQKYKDGFGNTSREFWLGNEKLHHLTFQGVYDLRVDMEDFVNERRYAKYSSFSVASEANKYRLAIGKYTGDAGDSLKLHSGSSFSTKDRDNDGYSGINCAQQFNGGWWYERCHHSNLNGLYLNGSHPASYANGVNWKHWHGIYYSLKKTEMKVRPAGFQ